MLGQERKYPSGQKISGGNQLRRRVKLDGSAFRVGIDKRLLIDAPHAFDGAKVERVMTAEITWMCGFNFAVGHVIFLLLLQSHDLFSATPQPLFPLPFHAISEIGFLGIGIDQSIDATGFHCRLIAIKRIAERSHHLAGTGYIAKLCRQIQQADLGLDGILETRSMGLPLGAYALA